MELFECVEVCAHCMSENILQWNTELYGFVANCKWCGAKMMLCDECQHTVCEDGEPHDCDWCDDAGGVCHRDDTPVLLSTYGQCEKEGDVQHVHYFTIPKNWLWEYVKENEWETLDNFLSSYTWDTTIDTYTKAVCDKIIQAEWED